MKGNQGLEALAILCNNASRSNDETANNGKEPEQQQTQMPPVGQNMNYNGNGGNGNMQHSSINFLPHQLQSMLKNMGGNQQQQQLANIFGSAGMQNDPQMYMNQMQQHPAMMQQAFHNSNGMFSGFNGMDPNSVNALVQSSQQQQNQRGGNFIMSNNVSHGNSMVNDNASMKPPSYLPHGRVGGNQSLGMKSDDDSFEGGSRSNSRINAEEKKLQKRAANRRSAQLSRKRKKQFIEELKEENDDLRRKEQILRSIPDLIVVFDSSGKLGFVSHSVSNFLEFTPEDLIGKSFWERLCEDSVRLLKAAFMDALAARSNDAETTPLGSGVWELRLQDKNGNFVLVTLNGVVHFSGDAPECVCSIRPIQSAEKSKLESKTDYEKDEAADKAEKKRPADAMYGKIKPEQSVVKKDAVPSQRSVKQKTGPDGRPVAISDVDSGTSIISNE
jgi:PAS domain S-box-containing protein